MPMGRATLSADGSTDWIDPGLGGQGARYWPFGVRGSLGGGVLKLQYAWNKPSSAQDGTYALDMEGLTTIPTGADRSVEWANVPLRLTLTGSTSPSVTIYYGRDD